MVGAGLVPEQEEGAAAGAADHQITPWGYSVYRQTDTHDMIRHFVQQHPRPWEHAVVED